MTHISGKNYPAPAINSWVPETCGFYQSGLPIPAHVRNQKEENPAMAKAILVRLRTNRHSPPNIGTQAHKAAQNHQVISCSIVQSKPGYFSNGIIGFPRRQSLGRLLLTAHPTRL